MEAACDVLGIGECSVDELVRVTAMPAPGAKARVLARERLPGGQIATALLACARLGQRTALLASVGDDAGAELALAPLRAAGVDLGRVRDVRGAATRSAWIVVDARGERTVLWERDAALALGPEALDARDVANAAVLLVDATDLALSQRAAELARELGRACVVDADAPAAGIDRLLATASHPVISESLATALYGSPEVAVRTLAAAGVALPVVTRGRAGSVAWLDGAARRTRAFAVEAIDTTGAGDAFHAGVAHGLRTGAVGAELLVLAHAVAACACRAFGAQRGLPTRAELAAFLAAPPPLAP